MLLSLKYVRYQYLSIFILKTTSTSCCWQWTVSREKCWHKFPKTAFWCEDYTVKKKKKQKPQTSFNYNSGKRLCIVCEDGVRIKDDLQKTDSSLEFVVPGHFLSRLPATHFSAVLCRLVHLLHPKTERESIKNIGRKKKLWKIFLNNL